MKGITFYMQYRDGGNWKSHIDHNFTNPKNRSAEEITEIFEKHVGSMYDPFIAEYYGLISIAELDNEFLPAINDYAHSFMEVNEIAETEIQAPTKECANPDFIFTSIEEWIEHVTNLTPEKLEELRQAKKEEVKEMLHEHINQLG